MFPSRRDGALSFPRSGLIPTEESTLKSSSPNLFVYSCRAVLPLGCLLLLFVLIAEQAPAQRPEWIPGERLTSAAERATTGTLVLIAGPEERSYKIANSNCTLTLRLLRLSGERELSMVFTSKSETSNIYEGGSAKMSLVSAGPARATTEFAVGEQTEGLAFAEIRSSSESTSGTLNRKGNGVRLIDQGVAIDLEFDATRVFREQSGDGFRMVAPLQPGQKVLLTISTSEFKGDLMMPKPSPVPTAVPIKAEAVESPPAGKPEAPQ